MKSPMVQNAGYLTKKGGYSDLMVLQSGAGFYIGTLWTDPDNPSYTEPGSRDSDYFPTREAAERELKALEGLGPDIAEALLRDHP